MAKERLQRVLAAAGVASRRQCEELILEGRVKVNGQRVNELPAFVDPDVDTIIVGSRHIKPAAKVYFLLNKPKGVACVENDPRHRKAVDMIGPGHVRLFCADKFDTDATGIVLITNDAQMIERLGNPDYRIAKTYVVGVKGVITEEAVEKMRKGIWFSDGKGKPESVKLIRSSQNESLLEFVLISELHRQIRRMLAKVGYDLKSMTRTQIGKLTTAKLPGGKSRRLTKQELEYLQKTLHFVD
jgi:23S rRNA pseudouridine2605 synthase